MNQIILVVFLAVWFFGIYYCRKVAMRLNMGGSNAVLLGIFFPVFSILIYFLHSYRNGTENYKSKAKKVFVASAILIALVFIGGIYYVIGTPEYSLYKLREAIINKEDIEVEKYLNIKDVAENFGELPSETQEWIDSMNTSILEIKEENSDKNKDAEAYVSTGLTGKYLEKATVAYYGEESDKPSILLKLNEEGAKLFEEITGRNIGKELAIFLNGSLVSAPVVEVQITNGEAAISGLNTNKVKLVADLINEEKLSTINGFKIRKKIVDGNSAEITIGKKGNEDGFELIMTKITNRNWRINKINVVTEFDGYKLPEPEGEKTATFSWKYKGKDYSLDQKLYNSYYEFYNSLPASNVFNGESLVGKLEKDNELFIRKVEGDDVVGELARSIKILGEKNNLNENQIVELVATFVQTIPYDTEKFNNRKAGLNGNTEKPTYPYEVLYNDKGVCQDKSYLAYMLLKEMGYGVSLFLFPEPADNHMAVGVRCPTEYSNYDSGFCFLETTSLGNKIGSTPNLSKEFGIATSKIELSDFSNDSTESEYNPLGKIEILNKADGRSYSGVIETFNTQKEMDNLLATVRRMDRELNAFDAEIRGEENDLDDMEKKLKKMANGSDFSGYEDYYSKYSKAFNKYKKDIKDYNAKVASRNQINNKYNSIVKSFYQ